MESIYWALSWACHRRCRHCYEDRFRPYVREDLKAVLREAQDNHPRIVENLPDRMTYLDDRDPGFDGAPREKVGRIILSGGECLLEPVRTAVTYPVIRSLSDRYRDRGGVKIVVQTTGDLLTPDIVDDLLSARVYMISVAGIDDFHIGMEGEERQHAQMDRLAAMFERAGLRRSGLSTTTRNWHEEEGPLYGFFGATPDSWIGKLWPRGRAWSNDLSTATLADNFCNRWSGGLNFLRHRHAGSEVSIEPTGAVYPCCIKTKRPIGSLLVDRLTDILDSLADEPAFAAISAGRPERMGILYGWSEEEFQRQSSIATPSGRLYANLCIGCDVFHERVLGPVLERAAARRRAWRHARAAAQAG